MGSLGVTYPGRLQAWVVSEGNVMIFDANRVRGKPFWGPKEKARNAPPPPPRKHTGLPGMVIAQHTSAPQPQCFLTE